MGQESIGRVSAARRGRWFARAGALPSRLWSLLHLNGHWRDRRRRGEVAIALSEIAEWPGTQATSLRTLHWSGKKDEHLRDMAGHFGRP